MYVYMPLYQCDITGQNWKKLNFISEHVKFYKRTKVNEKLILAN